METTATAVTLDIKLMIKNITNKVVKKTSKLLRNSGRPSQWLFAAELRISNGNTWQELQLSFYLKILLYAYGYFRGYLYHMGKKHAPYCKYWNSFQDGEQHTIFVCKRWSKNRTIVHLKLDQNDNWNSIAKYIQHILQNKKDLSCLND